MLLSGMSKAELRLYGWFRSMSALLHHDVRLHSHHRAMASLLLQVVVSLLLVRNSLKIQSHCLIDVVEFRNMFQIVGFRRL